MAAAELTTVVSLINYANRFKLADSAVFANDDPEKPSLLAVIDFHGGVTLATQDAPDLLEYLDETPGSFAVPRYGAHTAR